jgi:uncharacterized protein
MMRSCLYTGHIRHRRFAPRPHSFHYSTFLMYLDLGELDEVLGGRLLWSHRRPAPARFKRRHYLGDPSVPLEESVRRLVREKTGDTVSGPIRVLTHLQYFGYCFNPVSFYFCFDPEGSGVETIVAEINNTPWNERFAYVLCDRDSIGENGKQRFRFRKQFHVSPFLDMELDYTWSFTRPGATLAIHMDTHKGGRRVFDATMTLRRREISTWNLNAALLRYPFVTLKTISAIYWQALRLRLKGIPFYTHPAKRTQET